MRADEWEAEAKRRLAKVGIASSALEAQLLAAHALGKERSELMAHPEWNIPEEADALLQRRLKGEPLAYILGHREFFGRNFLVSPAVLIPRQETEILVETFLSRAADFPPGETVIDLGAGSGCIGITAKLERTDFDVTLSDISAPALEVATLNAGALGVEVRIVLGSIFNSFKRDEIFGAILSNPPYVKLADDLPREVRNFEPHGALFAGEDGLDFYRVLAGQARPYLKPKGFLIVEIGFDQCDSVTREFENQGWTPQRMVRDLAGIPRVLEFTA